ncbi:MAG: hypothetical protein J6A89_03235 [Clostridia bacterium]|nr:hypothetical protein [Clostridia bacterium]
MQVKEVVIEKFYNEHQKPSVIAKELGVNPSYVTKVIKKDDRYIREKEYRASVSKENRKEAKREWIRNKRQNDYSKQLYEYVKMQHNQAGRELSYSKEISDLAFAKWNRGMFRYDKNSSGLVLNKGFKFAFDVPKRVSNVVNVSSIKNKRIYV